MCIIFLVTHFLAGWSKSICIVYTLNSASIRGRSICSIKVLLLHAVSTYHFHTSSHNILTRPRIKPCHNDNKHINIRPRHAQPSHLYICIVQSQHYACVSRRFAFWLTFKILLGNQHLLCTGSCTHLSKDSCQTLSSTIFAAYFTQQDFEHRVWGMNALLQ